LKLACSARVRRSARRRAAYVHHVGDLAVFLGVRGGEHGDVAFVGPVRELGVVVAHTHQEPHRLLHVARVVLHAPPAPLSDARSGGG
jgi:hypothetical protein